MNHTSTHKLSSLIKRYHIHGLSPKLMIWTDTIDEPTWFERMNRSVDRYYQSSFFTDAFISSYPT